jgi:flagellar hook-associated protein 1 FlgK
VDFFTGTGADNIQVSSALYNSANPLLSHPELVAASTTLTPGTPPTPNVGDGTNALAIADLANSNLPDLSNQTFAGYFTNMTTDLGAQAQSATEVSDDNTTALNAYQTAIQGTDGVNLDEELLDMMSAQRAFEAASKVATTTDSMLNTLINVMT